MRLIVFAQYIFVIGERFYAHPCIFGKYVYNTMTIYFENINTLILTQYYTMWSYAAKRFSYYYFINIGLLK